MPLFNLYNEKYAVFSHFSPTWFNILKFCIGLRSNVPQNKLECLKFRLVGAVRLIV